VAWWGAATGGGDRAGGRWAAGLWFDGEAGREHMRDLVGLSSEPYSVKC
jgi:hypothetical protein